MTGDRRWGVADASPALAHDAQHMPSPNTHSHYDYVIVGGGTAGSVIAARLSERGASVLLLEAGPLNGPRMMSAATAWPAMMGSDVDWRFTTAPQRGLHGSVLPYPRGKVLGGSSAINALMHMRGHRSAIDAWVTAGAPGWGYDDLLPYYRRSERAVGFDPRYRGVDGPMRTTAAQPTSAAARAAFAAYEELGYPASADLNGAVAEGVAWDEITAADGIRESAADAYLRPFLDRPNLTVITDAFVHDVMLSGTRCVGVRYEHHGRRRVAHAAADVVLCAGAIGSPHLLLLSGIGPAKGSWAGGFDVTIDLPGVGANLADHPLGFVVYSAPQPLPQGDGNHIDVLAAVRSDPALAAPDLHLLFADVPLAPPAMQGQSGFTIGFALLTPRSRGSVTLVSADPHDPPAIDPGLLSDEYDAIRMLAGLRAARDVGTAGALRQWREAEVFPGPAIDDLDGLRASGSVGTYFHPVGTCRIGTDEHSVVDPQLRVHGVDGLRVVDASVMPSLPAANTNATVLAIAERAADIMTESATVAADMAVSRSSA
jgi:choline dehydrogenase